MSEKVNDITKPTDSEDSVITSIVSAFYEGTNKYDLIDSHRIIKGEMLNQYEDVIQKVSDFSRLVSKFSDSAAISTQKNQKDLSDYTITTDGVIEEQWATVETIFSRILEINENSVVLECLIDGDNRLFENRIFERALLEGKIPFKSNHPVFIKIYKRPGDIKFSLIDGSNLFDTSVFEIDYTDDFDFETKKVD